MSEHIATRPNGRAASKSGRCRHGTSDFRVRRGCSAPRPPSATGRRPAEATPIAAVREVGAGCRWTEAASHEAIPERRAA